MNIPGFELWSNDSSIRRMKNDSIFGQGLSGQRISMWFYLVLMTIISSGANAERVIESNKTVGIKATAWVLALISTLVSVFAMVFVIVHRQNKIVRVGQPFFLCLICFGSFLMSLSLYFDAGAIEEIPGIEWATLDKLCVSQLWCMYCGMLMVLGALICKLWRAEKACQFRKGQKILVRHVLWPFALLIVAEVVLLIAATVVCPPAWGEVLMDPFGSSVLNNSTLLDLDMELVDTADKIPKCFSSPLPAVTAMKGSSHALIVISQIVVLWMAYHTRNIPEEIVDTKRVYYLILCHFILYVPYLLLEYGVIPSKKAYCYISLIFPFLFSVTSVGFLVFPKVYYVFYFKRHGKLPDSVVSIVLPPQKIHVSGVSSSTRVSASTSKRISGDTRATPSTTSHTSTADVEDSVRKNSDDS